MSRDSSAHLPSLTSKVSIWEGPPCKLTKMTVSALPRGFTLLAAQTLRGVAIGSRPQPVTVKAPRRNASRRVSFGMSVGSIESSIEEKVQTVDHGPGQIFRALLLVVPQGIEADRRFAG